jgi:hypothetical protein
VKEPPRDIDELSSSVSYSKDEVARRLEAMALTAARLADLMSDMSRLSQKIRIRATSKLTIEWP